MNQPKPQMPASNRTPASTPQRTAVSHVKDSSTTTVTGSSSFADRLRAGGGSHFKRPPRIAGHYLSKSTTTPQSTGSTTSTLSAAAASSRSHAVVQSSALLLRPSGFATPPPSPFISKQKLSPSPYNSGVHSSTPPVLPQFATAKTTTPSAAPSPPAFGSHSFPPPAAVTVHAVVDSQRQPHSRFATPPPSPFTSQLSSSLYKGVPPPVLPQLVAAKTNAAAAPSAQAAAALPASGPSPGAATARAVVHEIVQAVVDAQLQKQPPHQVDDHPQPHSDEDKPDGGYVDNETHVRSKHLLAASSQHTPLQEEAVLDDGDDDEPDVNMLRPHQQPDDLPPSWEVLLDKQGTPYYYNHKTGTSSWDPPPKEEHDKRAIVDILGNDEDDEFILVESSLFGVAATAAATPPVVREASQPPADSGSWDALVDPASGATYYYNRETDETSWKLPTVAATAPERMTPPQQQQQHHSLSKSELEEKQEVGATTAEANDDTKQLLLPPGWEALVDPRSGETFYFHEASGDSSWDPPPPPATLEQVPTGDAPVQEPSAMTEPPAADLGIIQDTYKVAPETTNDSVAAAAVDETVAATSDPVDVSSADSTTLLPPGWEKLVDPSSGDTYYYNQSTDESSWDPPPLALSPEEEPTIGDDAAREESMVESFINAISNVPVDDYGNVEPLLPPGWEPLRDPSSGETYFFHQATGETSWSPPFFMTSSSALSSAAAEAGVDDTAAAVEEEKSAPEGAIPEKTQEDIIVADDNNYDYDSTAVEQPAGWEKLVDPDSHYLNEGTGDSSGVPPSVAGEPGSGDNVVEETTAIDLPGEPQEMADAFTKVVPDIAGARDESSALPPGWEKLVDPVSGETYYYNEVTGDSSWDPPSAQAEDPAVEPAVNVRDNPKAGIAEGADSAEVAIHSAGADELALLPGWERITDPDSGEIYYYNESTGEGSWDPQSAVASTDFKANGDSVEEPTDVEPVLDAPEKPEQEIAEVDESTQEVLAEATNYSEIVTDVAVAGVSALPPGWEELTDPNSGETYYYNEASGESSWDPPSEDPTTGGDAFDEPTTMEPGVDTPEKPKDELTEVAESMEIVADFAVAESSLPPGWKKVTYPDSGDTYFFNEATGESSWDPPSDVPVDEPTTMEPGIDTRAKPQDELSEVAESMEIVADVAVAESSLPPGWKKVINADSGETYFFNEETGESSWDPPSDVAPTLTSDGDSVDEPVTNEPSVAPNPPEKLTESAESTEIVKDDTGADELALSPVWEKLADPGSGETYYFNEATGESSWDPPAEAISEEGEPSSSHGMEEEPVIVEPDMSHEDGSVGPKYLLTVGEPPEEPIDVDGQKEIEKSTEAALKEGSALSRGWERVEDPNSGEAYYYNEATGETAWELPTAFRDPLVSANNAATGEPAVGESEASEVIDLDGSTGPNEDILPEEWEKVVDPNTGEAYYFNAATGETSWEVPALLEQPSRSLIPASVPVDTQADGPRDDDELDILPGWEKVVDPDSGEAYYYNAASGETSWEIPSAQSSGKDATTGVQLKGAEYHQRKKQGAGRPAHAIATFAFRGRLCVVRHIIGTKAVVSIHPTCRVVPSNAIVRAENVKKQTGFSGPLNLADEPSVTAFVDRNGLKGRDLLWNLVAICAKSRGRLRCDSRIDATDGPELAIVNLLLRDNENRVGENGTSTSPAKLRQENGNGTALHSHLEGSDLGSVQDHLLRGEREKAVEVALLGGHYAMALLVASMCNRETYYAAAKHYVDSVLLTTSPLHTAAMLFCGHLQAPEEGASTSSFWGVDATALQNNWRCHLAAIISNRTTGWDLIAVSLGDRLRDLGEIAPAHFCYMVCGCSVSPPVQGDSKMTLLGCSISPLDVRLMTDVALDGFARTEAYEWAKRRGNRNAAIQSLQGFKLQYAMLLCDLGFVQEAKDYVDSIMQRMGDKHEGAAEYRHPAFLSILSADSRSLFSHLIQFRRRLLSRDTRDAGYWGKSQEFEKEQDITFTTVHSSHEDEPPIPEASALTEFIPPEGKAKRTKKPVKVDKASRKEKAEPQIDRARHASRGSDHNESQPTSRTSILDKTAPMDARSQRPAEGPKPSFVATQPSLAVPTILPKPDVEDLALSTLTTSTAGAATSIPPIVTDKKPGREIVGSIPPFTPKAGSSDQKMDSKPLGIDVSTPKAEPPGVSKIKTAPTSAPANLQSAKSWGMFDFGIKEKITKILNPNAHQADVGQAMEAYYDKKLKVWVFPGEDPVELAKPVGPPPTLMTLQNEQPLSASPGTAASSLQPKDPLAAMMAPPQRTPARRLPKALPSPSGAAMPPPQFAVFQPKPAAAKADVDDGK